jgi:hypothetical protein
MRLYLLLISLFLISNTVKSSPQNNNSFGNIIFDCYYLNFAWGYQLNGFYINKDGEIFQYNRENNDRWITKDEKLTEQVLYDKYKNKQLVGKIELHDLENKKRLINKAALGKLSKKHTAYDAGERSCVTYLFNPKTERYTEIMLGSSGDFEQINSSNEAQKLIRWLGQLDTRFEQINSSNNEVQKLIRLLRQLNTRK